MTAGLSGEEAARRLGEYGANVVARERRTPVWRRVLQQLRDPLIVVLLVAAVLTLTTGDFPDASVILLVITVNTVAGVVQEVRAERAVAALTALSAPTARVIRDGGECSVPAAHVVPGDLVLLGEGDIVPADGEVVDAALLLVDESALTGESVPVEKTTGADRPPSTVSADAVSTDTVSAGTVSAGTVVVRGRGRGPGTRPGPGSARGR
ncbi:HAD-IC family P-type ATPase, partial [Streptomyces asiaticus]